MKDEKLEIGKIVYHKLDRRRGVILRPWKESSGPDHPPAWLVRFSRHYANASNYFILKCYSAELQTSLSKKRKKSRRKTQPQEKPEVKKEITMDGPWSSI